MTGRCHFCNSSKRNEYETACVSGFRSIASVAKELGVSRQAALDHMKSHVSEKIAKAAEALELQEGLNVVKAITESRERILSVYDEARKKHDLRSAIAALQAEVSQLSLMGKMTGQFSDQQQVNVLVHSSQDDKVMAVILQVLQPYPDIKIALSEALEKLVTETDA